MSQAAESKFVYVTFIRTTPEKLWSKLTDASQMREYWFGMEFKTEWKKGAEWKMVFPDGRVADTGQILELEPVGATVRLTVTHTIERAASKFIQAVSEGWPKILSNLKSLLETGNVALMEADHSHAR